MKNKRNQNPHLGRSKAAIAAAPRISLAKKQRIYDRSTGMAIKFLSDTQGIPRDRLFGNAEMRLDFVLVSICDRLTKKKFRLAIDFATETVKVV
ncbi:hypothetical protein Xen7305DRAFT_00008350 [Xenococcus sp. PCC 7305]|uniref:hypothetical protein n=1 Tax=Xenococcus sp. PCC 7305 TaxID=102125 RepID=UPI0002ACA42D|nr:hypothetical protein [Xenococcus sp. PCC 7305]ELS01133.1 hypothetical protein Xen7305DRAFT_00008350 [Xenococcus sp. PCC 7305]